MKDHPINCLGNQDSFRESGLVVDEPVLKITLRIDQPNHLNTIIQRISATGVIVGCYHDADTMGSMHGIELTADGSRAVTAPGRMNNGASPVRLRPDSRRSNVL